MKPSRIPLRRSIHRLLVRFRLTRRLLSWWTLLKAIRATNAPGQLALLLTPVVDSLRYAFNRPDTMLPVCPFELRVRVPSLDLQFQLRAWTDDIYIILPGREEDAYEAILEPLREGDVFVDIGANIGFYTMAAARRVGAEGTVIAVEALPANLEQLEVNLALNSLTGVRVVPAAAWSESGRVLTMQVPGRIHGMAAVQGTDAGMGRQSLDVRTKTIDEVCRGSGPVRVMKLDIEGSELEALRGAADTLARTGCVVAECTRDVEKIRELLVRSGFHVDALGYTDYIVAIRRP
jgi:FkbM family methyltransferase